LKHRTASKGFTRALVARRRARHCESANTVVSAINAAGQIVGGVYAGRGGVLVERGFVRDEHGTNTAFDAVPTAVDTMAQAINAHGWIAGTYREGNDAHG
jgi:hypothetical protein